jgi:dTDP-4-amino-4,6-dideoxygalactose transaminase
MSDRPAVLGGTPIFKNRVPIVRPVLPPLTEMSTEIERMLSTGMVTKGEHLARFEEALAAHLRVKHAIAVSNCTSGLMLVYSALGLTGSVIVPSFTFMATVSALVWAGLRPIFADVDEGTTNLDATAAAAAIESDTTAIIGVHNFGAPADIERLNEVARSRGLKLVFDAAHGFGALYRGVPVGPQGDAQVYSLSPTKLVIAGEGGVVATNDDDLAARVRIGREYGNGGGYDAVFAGLNARMAEFNAVLGLHSLMRLEDGVQHRNHVVRRFKTGLESTPGVEFQHVDPADRSSYKDLSVMIRSTQFGLERDDLCRALTAENIDIRRYYDPPVHRQTAYRRFVAETSALANTDRLAMNSVTLPIWSQMPDEVVDGICTAVERIHRVAAEVAEKLSGRAPAKSQDTTPPATRKVTV